MLPVFRARNFAVGGLEMADKPNGCGSLLMLVAVVFVVGKCVGGDNPAYRSPAPSYAESAPTAFSASDEPAVDAGASSGGESQSVPDAEAAAPIDQDQSALQGGPTWSGGEGYVDVDGHEVSSPVYAPQAPDGASAQCRDGTYSFSHHRRGTCSHHGGVAEWL